VQGPKAGEIVEIPQVGGCTIATNGALRKPCHVSAAVSLIWKTANYLGQGGHLSAQRLNHPDSITDQRPKHRRTGETVGLWVVAFSASTPLPSFSEGQVLFSSSLASHLIPLDDARSR